MAGVLTFISGLLGKNFAEKQLQQFNKKHGVPELRKDDQDMIDAKKGNRNVEFMIKATNITGDSYQKFWEKIAGNDAIKKAIDASAIKYLEGLEIAIKTNTQTAMSQEDIKEKLHEYFIANLSDKDVSQVQKEYIKATAIQNEGLKLLANSMVGSNFLKAQQAVDSFLKKTTLPRLGDIKPKDIDKRDIAMQLASQLWAARRLPENSAKALKNASATLASLPQQPQNTTQNERVITPPPIAPAPPEAKAWTQAKVSPEAKAKVPVLPKEALVGVTLNTGLKQEHGDIFHGKTMTPHRQSISTSSGKSFQDAVLKKSSTAPDMPPPDPTAKKLGK